MSMSTNLISGLSSGFDWRSMIDQLIAIEHRRVDLVENKKSEYEAKLKEWQSFNTKLLALKTAGEALKDPEDFHVYTASMSTDSSTVKASDLLSATAGSTASTGSYTLKITNLAMAQKLSSNPFTSKTEALGSNYAGDFLINGQVVTVSETDSLTDVAYSINSLNAGTDPSGVTATVVNYGTNDYRLVLTSDTTGADGISLLNGSLTDLVQRFGWKDKLTATIKNSITLGAQSDLFSSAGATVKSLIGLATGETGVVTIGDKPVTINLSTMSLTDIKTAINDEAPTGVTASVVSETLNGTAYYRLQIDGTQTFVDTNNILNTLGIQDHGSADVSGKVSGNSMTTNGAYVTAATLLKNIDGYNTFTAGGFPGGDYITLTGWDTDNVAVSANFSIESSSTVQDLLDEIETRYGDVIAYVTSDGKIRVDDLSGGGHLVVNLADHIADVNSELEFKDADADFGAAADRKREVVAGEDATVEIDGVEVTRTENTIDDIITGVTLNLAKEDDTTTVTLQIDHDRAAIKGKISGLVAKYNDVMSYINAQFTYDEEKEKKGGVLFGDGTLLSIKSEISSRVTETVWGVNANFSIIGLAGINLGNDILLSVNDTKLDGYLRTNFNDIVALFTGRGTTSSSTLKYVTHTKDTTANDYLVHIDQAATRGTATGSVDLSAGGAADTLTITQGDAEAEVTITADMNLEDIINALNTEFDTEYTRTLVGDQSLKEDDNVTYISASTTWDDIFGTTLEDENVISFTGTNRDGTAVSGSYTITSVSGDTVQGLLSEIESAFSNKATATLDTSGRLVLTDLYAGTSEISLVITAPAGSGLDFGTVDITEGAGDGSQEGRYAMTLTAGDDGSNHLVIENNDYGSASFSLAQDTSELGMIDGIYSGLDVTGTIGGEAATGSGQILTGNDDNAHTAGLSVQYSGTIGDTDAGTVTLTLGFAALLGRTLYTITDPLEGYEAFKEDSLQNSIDSFETRIEQMEALLNRKTESMVNRFVAMELALSKIQSQSDWLTGQLNAAAGGWK